MLLLAGIACLVRNAFFSERYSSTELIPVSLIVQGTPRLANKFKGTTTVYRLEAYNQHASFIISHGALDIIKNKPAENIISTLHTGDTVNIQIKASDERYMKTHNREIRVIGCEVHGQSLFTPTQVEEKDKRSWWVNMYIAAGLFTISLIMQAVQFKRWIHSYTQKNR
ncbi:hypothetical protein [Chitinophaga sp. Cy-1792]|uniref:hypothetical protein n=1 Tax=Chitinophaga sp. Cy-1792 TaxID=2608339 RepID=UPI00141EA45E|nr:hypothetical protein [Chitinophaga sp. Cy-1792]NIG56519.1 hypothetical protein [Chitinophaga sp. Cy-1792]